MLRKYLLETYKILLTFVLVGIVALLVEQELDKSVREREKESLVYENAVSALEDFATALATYRAASNRFVKDTDADYSTIVYESYRVAYSDYTRTKVSFIYAMEELDKGSEEDKQAYTDLNVSVISLDECVLSASNGHRNCDLKDVFEEFVDLSTDFENRIRNLLSEVRRG